MLIPGQLHNILESQQCIPACNGAGVDTLLGRDSPWAGTPRQTPPGQPPPPPDRHPLPQADTYSPRETATEPGGTHPTGIHSCER